MQIDQYLYLRTFSINPEWLETQHIIGNSFSRQTKEHDQHNVLDPVQVIEDFPKQNYRWLLILTIDEYTSMQTKQRTLDDKASVAKYVCKSRQSLFRNPSRKGRTLSTVYMIQYQCFIIIIIIVISYVTCASVLTVFTLKHLH